MCPSGYREAFTHGALRLSHNFHCSSRHKPTKPEFREETVTGSPLWAAAREILQTFTKQKEKFGLNRTHVAKLRMSGEKENSVSSCAPPLFGHMENQSECGQSRKTLFFSAPPTVE